MQAIIMAGGQGTRLRPLTKETPKPMVRLLGRPLMEYSVELLKKHGFNDIGVTVLYLPQNIKEYFGNGERFGVKMKYFEETEPLGTAGSVKSAQNELDEAFALLSGDALTNVDLSKVMSYHKSVGADVTIVLSRQEDPLEYGVVLTGTDCRVLAFEEKPQWENVISDTVNTGIYIINKSILDEIPPNTEFDFSKDLFPKLLKNNAKLYGYITEDYWCDLGTPEAYIQAHKDILLGKLFGEKAGNVIEEGVKISEQTKLVSPVYISKNTVISGDSVIGPFTVIGEGCILNSVKLENSVLWDKCVIEKCECNKLIAGNGVKISEAVFGGNNIVGSGSTLEKNVHLMKNAYIVNNTHVARNTTVSGTMSFSNASENSLWQNGSVVGIWDHDIFPQTLLGIASSYKKDKILISYNDDRQASAIASLLASYYNLCGTDVYLARANEASCRFHSCVYKICAIYIRCEKENTVIDIIDEKGLNISSADERKISFTADSMSVKIGRMVKLTTLDPDFEYFLNSAIPFSDSNAEIYINEKFRIHNVIMRSGSVDTKQNIASAAVVTANGGISSVYVKGEKLSVTEFMHLLLDITEMLGCHEVFLPAYAPENILKEAEKRRINVLSLKQHKGNSMQQADSFNNAAVLLEFVPVFFAQALAYYLDNNEVDHSDNTVISRFSFDCFPGSTCSAITALNKNKTGTITAEYKNGFITVIPKNNGYSFTAYGRFSKEEYAPDIVEEFVNNSIKDI